MGRLLLLIIFLATVQVSGQSEKIFFSESLDMHLPSYLRKVERSIALRQQDSVKFLFDELVEEKLTGTILNDFKAKTLNRKERNLSDFEKPALLITYSSWRINSKGEQEAINEIAKEYGNDIDIILLFWGDTQTVKSIAKGYHRNTTILHVNDMQNEHTRIIKNLKHSLGLPLVYALTSNKEIVGIQRRISNKMKEDLEASFTKNHEYLNNAVVALLIEENKVSDAPFVVSN